MKTMHPVILSSCLSSNPVGKLIIVVGNSGVGKTTLTQVLQRLGNFTGGLEQIGERPFQARFAADLLRFALPNQIDYLLLRAEQEQAIRRQPGIGIQDGGLDLDFHLFTQHFWQKGYLAADEYALCARFYAFTRQCLPPPDLIIYLAAPLHIISQRYQQRNRRLEITQQPDLAALDVLLAQWLGAVKTTPILTVDATQHDPGYAHAAPALLRRIFDVLT